MKDRLLLFMNRENISATMLADEIGVQRSSISHIISGRNNPSYDFIHKMKIAIYCRVSTDEQTTENSKNGIVCEEGYLEGKGSLFRCLITLPLYRS